MGGVGLCGNRKDWKECFKDLLETKSKDIEARWVTEWWQGVKLRRRKKTCGVEMSCSADGASLEDQRRRGPPCSLNSLSHPPSPLATLIQFIQSFLLPLTLYFPSPKRIWLTENNPNKTQKRKKHRFWPFLLARASYMRQPSPTKQTASWGDF